MYATSMVSNAVLLSGKLAVDGIKRRPRLTTQHIKDLLT